jgi:hypothetical protein
VCEPTSHLSQRLYDQQALLTPSAFTNRRTVGKRGDLPCFLKFTRSTDGGATWSTPIRVNNDQSGNDQYFPDVAVNGQGVIQVVWYDQRLDPQNLRIDVFKAFSYNGGVSFGPNLRVTHSFANPIRRI